MSPLNKETLARQPGPPQKDSPLAKVALVPALFFQLDIFNMLNSRSQSIAYADGSLIPSDLLFRACNGLANIPVTTANCGTGVMGVVGLPIEPVNWRLTFGGPIDFDAKLPDLTEPVKVVKFWE